MKSSTRLPMNSPTLFSETVTPRNAFVPANFCSNSTRSLLVAAIPFNTTIICFGVSVVSRRMPVSVTCSGNMLVIVATTDEAEMAGISPSVTRRARDKVDCSFARPSNISSTPGALATSMAPTARSESAIRALFQLWALTPTLNTNNKIPSRATRRLARTAFTARRDSLGKKSMTGRIMPPSLKKYF